MLKNITKLEDALLELESSLRIEYREKEVSKILNQARKKIEIALAYELKNHKLPELMGELFVKDSIMSLMLTLSGPIKSISLVSDLSIYNGLLPFSLLSVNYLGYTQDSLRNALKSMQVAKFVINKEDLILNFKKSVSNLSDGVIKRVFVCMIFLYDLGIEDGAAVLAKLLYLACSEL